MEFDFSSLSPNQIYHTMIQSIVPRPIAWVLSQNDSGNYNLAPFSYFTAVASDPPLVMFSVGKKPDNSQKDTLKNINTRKRCVIHIADKSLAQPVSLSAATLPYGQSEIEHANLTTTEFDDFPLPRVEQAKIALGCSLFEIKEIGNKPMALIFAEIEKVYVNDDIIERNDNRTHINAEKLNPLVRLGGDDYASISTPFTVERPK